MLSLKKSEQAKEDLIDLWLYGLEHYGESNADFYFDEYNTGTSVIQNINSVSLVGNFNNWNDTFDPMQDDNNDGLWEVTVTINN